MTEAELVSTIEATKGVVLRAVQRHLSSDLAHLVEDIAQETYLRYYLKFEKRAALPKEEQARWLYVVARNHCRNIARKSRREEHTRLRVQREHEVAESSRDGLVSGRSSRHAENIHKRAADLPEPYREVTLLRLSGLNLKAIASRLGLRTGTVKSRLSRGRDMLARVMVNDAGRTGKET